MRKKSARERAWRDGISRRFRIKKEFLRSVRSQGGGDPWWLVVTVRTPRVWGADVPLVLV